MFLYELAVELGQRSSDLVLAAESLGMGELLPATMLDAQQVAALRAHFRSVAPAAGPLSGSPPPLPAPDLGPLVAAPPGPDGGLVAPTPRAPASWGPPTPAAAAAVAATPPPPPSSNVAGGPMAFGPPGLDDAPADAAGPPTEGLPKPLAPPPAAETAPADPGAAGPGDGDGLSRGQLVALAVVGALVVCLFAWMMMNTGPSDAQKKRTEAIAPSVVDLVPTAAGAGEPESAPVGPRSP